MNNYIITGSIGHISKPVVEGLVSAGKNVTVITSNDERVAEIEQLGARALVGSVLDAAFLKDAFHGADVAYTMIPPIWQTSHWRASMNEVGNNYAAAIQNAGINYVVNLSSIGAHLGSGAGPVDGVADFEKMLNKIPGLNVKHLRPSIFFYNFYTQVGLIKQAGIMGGNYGENDKLYLVHTQDIAAAALEELVQLKFTGNSVRYIYGDERYGKEIAETLGNAIGKKIQWITFNDDDQKKGLLQAGLSETHAEGYTQMGRALRDGSMQAELRTLPVPRARVGLEEFAKEFAAAFAAHS